MREIQRNSVLRMRLDLPNATFFRGVQVGEIGAGQRPIRSLNVAPAGVVAFPSVGRQFESDVAFAFVAPEGIHAPVGAAVIFRFAFVKF